MFKNITIKTKLFFPMSILAIIFLILTTSIIGIHYNKSKMLLSLESEIILATKLSKLLHHTQKERGLSAGYIVSRANSFQSQLQIEQFNTDQHIDNLKKFLSQSDFSHINTKIKKELDKMLVQLKKLQATRENIRTLHITINDAIVYYTNLNDIILNTIIEISKVSQIPSITQNIIAYSNFLYAKENAGIERAIGTAIITTTHLKESKLSEFNTLIEKQNLYMEIFLKYASADAKARYKIFLTDNSIKEVDKLRNIIFHTNDSSTNKIEPGLWFNTITTKIDKLKKVDNYLEKEIIANIESELRSSDFYFLLFTALNIISIILFLAMIFIVIQLINSEKRLKILMDKYVISSTTDTKGIITSVSEAFCKISGFTEKELIGKAHNITRHPDMSSDTFKAMWETIKSGQTWGGKIKNRTKDGDFYWVYANIEPLLDSQGNVESYAAIRLNITESEAFQEKIKYKDKLFKEKELEQKEHLNTVIESNNQAIIALNSQNIILTYNSKAEKVFGFSKEEMLGTHNLTDIIPIQYRDLHSKASKNFFETGVSKGFLGTTFTAEGLRKDGTTFPMRLSLEASKNKENQIIVASIVDITQELVQDKILKQQAKLAQMGEMISMIAHQWRQPLSAISAAAGVINLKSKLNKLDKELSLELSDKIVEYTKHLSSTIDDFREFFKSNKEQKETSYTEIIDSIMNIIESSMKNENISFIKELQCEERFYTFDNEIKQVILNLIKNAEDILLENKVSEPYIKIASYKQGNSIILEVSDNGGGIPENIIDNIFDPYFSTKTKKDGTGLGLYMSKTIIEDHCKGTLSVENNSEGAVFKIILGNGDE